MPEGPEIRREADQIAAVIKGQPCLHIECTLSILAEPIKALQGHTITDVTSHGKAMLITFDNDVVIYSHNQLYGRWRTQDNHTRPASSRQLRLAIDTPKGSALLYSASDISIWHKTRLYQHPLLRKLGPDILDNATTEDMLKQRLDDDRFSGRQLASLLLDQGFVAGMGNYLRSEVLFFSGLSASRKLSMLTSQEKDTLAMQLKAVAIRSYKTKGITLPLPLLEQQKKQYQRFEDYRFAVFSRAGEPCIFCSEIIERTMVSGRRWYFCRKCQR
ncbi:endonuclease VIII [Alteromonas sp. CYL-A6]|uniref:endonuclease VIII n=1 Tax=Alteromonas nitratireducens TaxID=3390813 RepID=UPI0034C18790